MAIFRPDARRTAPPATPAQPDRVPDGYAAGTPPGLRDELIELLGADAVLSRAVDLVRYSSDASPYRLIPQAVVRPRTAEEIAGLMRLARRSGRHLTFRAAGTSLNGQAQGDGILVDVRHHWAGLEIGDDGARVRVRPGTIIGRVNAALARYGRRLGPDPASSHASTVGGAIANNASGFAAGTVETAYRTLRSATIVLTSGTIIDTGAPDADRLLADAEPGLAHGLTAIKKTIESTPGLAERIRAKHQIKNTNGYRLDAFLDEETPARILRRLIVGSEGTLGFVAEAVLDTVPLRPVRADALLLYPTVAGAAARVPDFVNAGAQVCELLDSLTLKGASMLPVGEKEWMDLPDGTAALLVEVRAEDEEELAGLQASAEEIMEASELLRPGSFTRDREVIERLWTMREGLLAIAGSMRPAGSSLLIEDMCVPPERIAEAVGDIQALLGRYGFTPSVQGHASAGNLHFSLNPRLGDAEDRRRYDDFMGEAARLIIEKYDGSLKAEHGTGRNMAPYIATEWGAQGLGLMWQLRKLLDPDQILSPDVMLSKDPEVHLRNLHSVPAVEDVIDKCIECGFCEPVCPSRRLTTTPRQRIALRREMARQPVESAMRRTLLDQYRYDAIETCAGDGSCALACPIGIDTGKLMKRFRHAGHGRAAEYAALRAAKHWGLVERAAWLGLRAGGVAGPRVMSAVTGALRAVIGPDQMPAWLREMPRAAPARLPATRREGAAAVYFPACINRIFGLGPRSARRATLPEAMVAVSARAGLPLWIPGDATGTCCATVWHSKGFRAGNAYMVNKIVEGLWRWTGEGRLPVVVDASSCTLGVTEEVVPYLTAENRQRHEGLTVYDSIIWARDHLLPRLALGTRLGRAAVHPTCSSRHLGVAGAFEEVAAQLAEEVVVPEPATCCGFAGDRGLLHPELTEAATEEEAAALDGRAYDCDVYLCSNRTCEIGLEHGTGRPYESFVHVLDELTR